MLIEYIEMWLCLGTSCGQQLRYIVRFGLGCLNELTDFQLGIARVAQASSVNVVRLVWSVKPKLYYLPLDEEHPREPDEPYGLSKV